jgi:hypothetical protein
MSASAEPSTRLLSANATRVCTPASGHNRIPPNKEPGDESYSRPAPIINEESQKFGFSPFLLLVR